MNSKSISIQLADGPATTLSVFQPADFSDETPCIVCLPALGVKASFYQPLAEAFTDAGFGALTADFRGIGASTIRSSRKVDFGYHEIVSYDIPGIIGKARQLWPENPVFILGHSLGGQLSALSLSIHSFKVKGLIMVTTASPYYKGWSGLARVGMFFVSRLFKWSSQLLGFFPGHIFRFAGKEAKTLMVDWCNYSMTNRIEVNNSSINFDEKLRTLQIPILAFSIDTDWMVPESATRFFLDKMPAARIEHIHVPHGQIVKHKLNHFNWVKHPMYFVNEIKDWALGLE